MASEDDAPDQTGQNGTDAAATEPADHHDPGSFTYGTLEARPEDDRDPTVRRSQHQHYHFLLEFCHTHPGSHEKKDPHWRQEVVVDLGPEGAPLVRSLPADFDAFLDDRQRFGVKVGLDNTRALLARLGLEGRRPPAILVAGTNGKGTVATALGEAVSFAGYRPGVYTSPHVERFLERIQISGADPDDEVLEAACHAVRAATEALDNEGVHATYFEVATALALDVFRRHRANPIVLEVGLGGRGDATNAIEPAASVITNVGSDHAEQLGATLAQRVREKAGILRPGVPCFTTCQGEALRLLREDAINVGAPLVAVLPEEPVVAPHDAYTALVRTVLSDPMLRKRLPRLGQLDRTSIRLPQLPARQEGFKVHDGPRILLDAAHNTESLAHLADSLDHDPVPRSKRTLLVGLLRDKPAEAIAALAEGRFAEVRTTRPEGDRARTAEQLAEALHALGVPVADADDDAVHALVTALDATPPDGLLVVAGSFYLAGRLRPMIRQVAHRG